MNLGQARAGEHTCVPTASESIRLVVRAAIDATIYVARILPSCKTGYEEDMPMIKFSSHVMKEMGFAKEGPDNVLRAKFELLVALEVPGLQLEDDHVIQQAGEVAEVKYRVAIGSKANAAARALVGSGLRADEAEWMKNAGLRGPFIVIAIVSDTMFEVVDPYISRRVVDHIVTCRAFLAAETELEKLRSRAFPQIQLALCTELGRALGNPLGLKTVATALVGRTEHGIPVTDFQVAVSAHGTVSTRRRTASLQSWLDQAVSIAPYFRQKSGRPFAAALDERDHFKRFFFFFLSLEIETNEVFTRLSHGDGVDKLLTGTGPAHGHAAAIFRRQASELKNLAERFVWCALNKWPEVTEADIELFHRLKKARDDIAHGNTQEPPAGYAAETQRLAQKVLSAGR